MLSYLFKVLFLLCFSSLIIWFYYFDFSFHLEKSTFYLVYAIIILVIYSSIKGFQFIFPKKEITYTPFSLFSYFLLHLFVLSSLFFYFIDKEVGNGILLFFKIIFFSFLPVCIILITTAFGKKIFSIVLDKFSSSGTFLKGKQEVFKFIVSLGLGFFLFLFFLTILGALGFYNLISVFFLLLVFLSISFRDLSSLIVGFFTYEIKFDFHNLKSKSFLKNISLPLISSELLFIIATLILSVSLISIVRPIPIGWDDLGAYMNQPRLLVGAGDILSLGSMFSWQIFTGIGYMFNSATQAFFLNNVGGVASFIVLILVFSDLLKGYKKTFINLPLLLATAFISMPMVIFQQAKDMKLDTGLFFVSVIAVYMLYKVKTCFFAEDESKTISIKEEEKKIPTSSKKRKIGIEIIFIFIIGLLVGFAFSIKFTSLILISAIIGVLFYSRAGIFGFLGYIAIFFGIFTKAGLWSYMNVAYPKDDIDFRNKFFIICLFVSISFLVFATYKNLKAIKKLFIELAVLLLGIFIALSPWIYKNLYTSYPEVSISSILSGKTISFSPDYSKIYSKQELEVIEKYKIEHIITSSGTTANEDFGRYFGYEKGINNYIKLPWNLTMQSNQKGEFTDIGFLFLALLPVILIFLPFRNKYFYFGILFLLILEILLFVIPSTGFYLTNLLSKVSLPFGYFFILASFLLPLLFFLFSLKDKNTKASSQLEDKNFELKKIKLFKLNLIFSVFYVFLWCISAFGIVWYGIVMYFSLLLMIAISAYYLSGYEDNDSDKKISIKFFSSIILLFIFFIYFLVSSVPHVLNNLKSANYPYYKSNKISSDEGVFLYHREYLSILFELNISKDKRKQVILNAIDSPKIKKIIENKGLFDISQVSSLLSSIEKEKNVDSNLKALAKKSKLNLYTSILKPSNDYKSSEIIYRVGTFLKYFITQNNKRLLEDSLLTTYDKYIYDENSISNTVSRIKGLGINYLLVDLNAATIDKDPRHDLTRRYENILKIFVLDDLELVQTDSICLKIALEDYKKSSKTSEDMKKYIYTSGVNYKSYSLGNIGSRNSKILACYNRILVLISTNKVDDNSYVFLLPLKNYIRNSKVSNQNDLFNILSKNVNYGYKVLFRVK